MHSSRWASASWAASALPGLPLHAFRAGSWRPAEGEGEAPGCRAHGVDGVEVGGGQLGALPAGEEGDAGDGGGDGLGQAAPGGGGHGVDRRRVGAPAPGQHHVGLEDHALEGDLMGGEGGEDGPQGGPGGPVAVVETVVAVP